jgi:hypothetical protein
MPLNQAEFLSALSEFESDLIKTREALYKALKKPPPTAQREQVILAGRRKLAEYEGLLARLTKEQREQAEGSFEREVAKIRERVQQLTDQRAT